MPRATLLPLLPRLTVEWARREPGTPWRLRDGTMAFADISGFSRLSERLAELGPPGTEELTDLINTCFEGIVAAALGHGGDVLKIVGDGVLVWFEGDDHEVRACAGCVGMHAALERPLATRAGRPVRLRMSAGASTGQFAFVMTAGRHRELFVGGPAVSDVLRCEKEARPGETLISDELAARVPTTWVGARRTTGRVLRPIADLPATPAPSRPARPPDLTAYIPEAQRELINVGAPGEHRQCAVAFVSLVGTDALVGTGGTAALADALARVGVAVDDATVRWGTQWLSSDNAADAVGFMLTGGVPTSSGHDEERLLRTVRQVMDECPLLDLRAGVHRGRIYSGFVGAPERRGFTVVGDVVNLSARLMQRAGEHQMIATRVALDWSDTRFEEHPLESFLVKGRTGVVEASIVGEIAVRKTRGVIHDLPLVGRHHELSRLELAADEAAAGRGSVLVVLGDPGIGKSRLLVELQRRRPSLDTLTLAADEYSSTVPYSLLRTMLGSLAGFDPDARPDDTGAVLRRWIADVAPDELPWFPLLATAFGIDAAPTRESDELAERFRSARLRRSTIAVLDRVLTAATLLVVDDAQWVDDASAELLANVISDVPDRSRLVCLLVSGHDVPPWAADVPSLELTALGDDETRTLASSASTGRVRARDLEELAARSGGNPLFLANLVDAAHTSGQVETLPSTIESLITRRIDDLDARDRMLLRQAAVAGMDIDLPLIGRVLGAKLVNRPDAWRRLSPFVARSGPGRLRFQHGLYQRVAYEGLSFRRRREIHLALGDDLERRGAEAAVLSLHFWRAEDHGRAYRWSASAAQAARQAYANTEAAELYRRALASASPAGIANDDTTGLAEALGDVLELAADYDEAAGAYTEARRRAAGGAPDTEARLHRKTGVLRERAGAYGEALRWYSRAIRLLGEPAVGDNTRPLMEPLAELAEIELAYAGVRFRQGRTVDSRSWVDRAIAHATAAGDDDALGHAHYLLTLIDVALGDTAPASGQVALAILERSGNIVQQAKLYNNLGIAAYFAGDWDAALDRYERSRDASHRAGDLVLEATVVNNVGEILSDRGRLPEAFDMFRRSLETFEAARYPLGIALTIGNLGRAHLRGGDLDAAQGALQDARARFESIRASSYVAETLVRLAECAVVGARPDDALALLEEAAQATEADAFLAAASQRVRAEALFAAGEFPAAAAAAEIAVDTARRAGATFEQARSLAVRATARAALAAAADHDAMEAAELLAGLGVPG